MPITEAPKPRIIKTRESLKYTFSDTETLELSRRLARLHQEAAQVEDAKQKAVADFKAEAQSIDNQITDHSRRINNGYEYRSIDCELQYHSPERGWKKLIRLDTFEAVKTSKMEAHELQEVLFEEEDTFPEADEDAQPQWVTEPHSKPKKEK